MQAGAADLIAPGRYQLTRLLRGQRETEGVIGPPPRARAPSVWPGSASPTIRSVPFSCSIRYAKSPEATAKTPASCCKHASGVTIAAEGLRQIADFYAVEADIRGIDAGHRLSARQARTAPLVAAFGDWLQQQRVSQIPGHAFQ